MAAMMNSISTRKPQVLPQPPQDNRQELRAAGDGERPLPGQQFYDFLHHSSPER
jgi:hypothetical protein